MGKSKHWVVWCRSKKKDEEQRPFEVDGKEIYSNCSKQAKPKVGEKTDKTAGKWQKCNLVSGMASVASDMGWL